MTYVSCAIPRRAFGRSLGSQLSEAVGEGRSKLQLEDTHQCEHLCFAFFCFFSLCSIFYVTHEHNSRNSELAFYWSSLRFFGKMGKMLLFWAIHFCSYRRDDDEEGLTGTSRRTGKIMRDGSVLFPLRSAPTHIVDTRYGTVACVSATTRATSAARVCLPL